MAQNEKAEWVYKLYSCYTIEDLNKHPAAIILPYSVMSYRITELYALGIPLLIPSLRFYLSYYDSGNKQFSLGWDRTSTKTPYCKKDANLERKMRLNITFETIHPYSPNIDFLEDAESEMYWLQFSDFYEWPHIQYFDDYKHLKNLLLKADFAKIRRNMKQEVDLRKNRTVNSWCRVINKIGSALNNAT